MSSRLPRLSDLIHSSSPTNSDVGRPRTSQSPGSRRSSTKRLSRGRHSGGGSRGGSLIPNGSEDEEREEEDTLVGLSIKRDTLLERRKQLLDLIKGLDQQIIASQEQDNNEGDDLIEISEDTYQEETLRVRPITKKRKTRGHGLNSSAAASRDQDHLDTLRQQLNKLPAMDNWELRLKLLKFFQPYLEIDIKSLQVVENLKYVRYELKYAKFFKIEMTLKIDMKLGELIDFTMKFVDNNVPFELMKVIRGSKDITFVIYSINSYVKLVIKKINICLQLFEKYKDKYTLNDLESSNELINFFKFKNNSVISIKSNNDVTRLDLIWNFEPVKEPVPGGFNTVIKCLLIKDNTMMTNYDELLTECIIKDGLFIGMCTVIDNLLL